MANFERVWWTGAAGPGKTRRPGARVGVVAAVEANAWHAVLQNEVTRRVTEPANGDGVWYNGRTPNREGLPAPAPGG